MLSSMKNYSLYSEEEIKKFLRQSKIIKLQNRLIIYQFWEYFENFIKKFRGVNENNFFLYLKEAEFRFNNFKISLKDIINS